jgi:hypothetical protein
MSLWVVILRLNSNLSNNFLPKEFEHYFTKKLGQEIDATAVEFF